MYNRQHLARTLVAVALTVATVGAGGGLASADGHHEHGHTPKPHHFHFVDHATGRISLPVTEFTLIGHGFSNVQGRTSSVLVHNASGDSVTVSSEEGDSIRMVIGASLPTPDVVCPVGAYPARSNGTIVGGTDRFADATGTFVVTACNAFSDFAPDGVTLNSTADAVGTIIF